MTGYRRILSSRKVVWGSGITSIAGLLAYHVYLIQSQLQKVVDPRVLDCKKRPDYIYINYSIYRESQQRINQQKQQDINRNFVNIISNPVNKCWKTIKHSLAWRLLKTAQTADEKQDRMKAIHQLAMLTHLKVADFQHLAQICDADTAIALARSECDLRWFLPPKKHGVITNPKELLKRLHNLLDELKTNQCAAKLLNKTFGKYKFKDVEPEKLYMKRSTGLATIPKDEIEMLKQCVDVLLHLTEDKEVADQIIAAGGLDHLMEIHKIFRDSMDIKLKLCQIVTNMSLCRDRQYDFFVTGWVSVLAAWGRDVDIRLNVTSNKALSNLDKDANGDRRVYKSKIYPLYPRLRTKAEPQLDIVFVHGILGGVFMTWRQKEERFEQLKASSMTKKLTKNGANGSGTVEGDWKDGSPHPESVIPMMQRSPKRQMAIHLDNSPGLAHDIMEAVQNARSSLSADWEVVYADCPQEASEGAIGPFSISGESWMPADEEVIEEEYTNCWAMDWLQEKFPEIRVLGLNYTSTLSEWYSKNHGCGCKITQGTIESRAQEFLDQLSAAGVGEGGRPVVYVGHSMGGLIVKSIVTQAMESERAEERTVADSTKAIMFLGTPHRGTPVAKLKQHLQMLLSPSVEVREMEENSSSLLRLHEKFLQTMEKFGNRRVEVVSVAEGNPTVLTPFKLSYEVVTEQSAKIELGDYYKLADDHLGICKPSSRQSFLYRRLIETIRRAMHQEGGEEPLTRDV